ncbi:head-tail adaptor protein [Streptosporangium sp. DT93]|uniref:head-tail adaptor protein n=1 Tax=Streptosporangium sp. DT93 TaxID=3393428 RepID=UPI003CFB5C5E
MIAHLLNRNLGIERREEIADGGGGHSITWLPAGTVRGRRSQPTSTERESGDQHGADLTDVVYLPPGADVHRGDRLLDGAEVLEVLATYSPSVAKYLRADCRSRDREEEA